MCECFDLQGGWQAKFNAAAAAAAAAGVRFTGTPRIWCKLRDVRLEESGAGGDSGSSRGGSGGAKVVGMLAAGANGKDQYKPTVNMLPVCHNEVMSLSLFMSCLCQCLRALGMAQEMQ